MEGLLVAAWGFILGFHGNRKAVAMRMPDEWPGRSSVTSGGVGLDASASKLDEWLLSAEAAATTPAGERFRAVVDELVFPAVFALNEAHSLIMSARPPAARSRTAPSDRWRRLMAKIALNRGETDRAVSAHREARAIITTAAFLTAESLTLDELAASLVDERYELTIARVGAATNKVRRTARKLRDRSHNRSLPGVVPTLGSAPVKLALGGFLPPLRRSGHDELGTAPRSGPPGDVNNWPPPELKQLTMDAEWPPEVGQRVSRSDATPVPSRIGITEVRQLEVATRALRALDYQHGGAPCRDAIVVQLSWGYRMITATGTDLVRVRLLRALADLQNLAGWTAFDVGLLEPCWWHFSRALELAKQSGDHGLLSNIMYRIGRVYLHHDAPDNALKWFQVGQTAAENAGSELAVAVLCVNEAWAYAAMSEEQQALKLLGKGRDQLSRANRDEAPDWMRFFNETDMQAMTGIVHTVLSARQLRHATIAIRELTQAAQRYTAAMNRSRAFMLMALSMNHLREGDVDEGVRVGKEVLDLVVGMRSARVVDRLGPMQIEAAKRASDPDARELAHLAYLQRAG